jgi:hypothetical protein
VQIKKPIENRPGDTDFSCEFPLVITKLKIIAKRLGAGADGEFEPGKCDQCDGLADESWALENILQNCIGELEHINASVYGNNKAKIPS